MYHPKTTKNIFAKNTWITYSPKIKRNIYLFSELEYEYWTLIETNPKVIDFCEHPKELCSYHQTHRVDMWVLFENEEHLVKISYAKNISQLISEFSVDSDLNGKIIKYITLTEKEIRSNIILLSNMKILLSYIKNRKIPLELDRHRILKEIGNKPISLLDLELRLPELTRARVREAIIWLLYEGQLISDLEKQPFSCRTEVCLKCLKEE